MSDPFANIDIRQSQSQNQRLKAEADAYAKSSVLAPGTHLVDTKQKVAAPIGEDGAPMTLERRQAIADAMRASAPKERLIDGTPVYDFTKADAGDALGATELLGTSAEKAARKSYLKVTPKDVSGDQLDIVELEGPMVELADILKEAWLQCDGARMPDRVAASRQTWQLASLMGVHERFSPNVFIGNTPLAVENDESVALGVVELRPPRYGVTGRLFRLFLSHPAP